MWFYVTYVKVLGFTNTYKFTYGVRMLTKEEKAGVPLDAMQQDIYISSSGIKSVFHFHWKLLGVQDEEWEWIIG